jgi:hypothetical protein
MGGHPYRTGVEAKEPCNTIQISVHGLPPEKQDRGSDPGNQEAEPKESVEVFLGREFAFLAQENDRAASGGSSFNLKDQ